MDEPGVIAFRRSASMRRVGAKRPKRRWPLSHTWTAMTLRRRMLLAHQVRRLVLTVSSENEQLKRFFDFYSSSWHAS